MYATPKDDTVHSLQNARNLSEAKHSLREVVSDATRKVTDIVRSASGEVSHAKESVTTQIRSNPVQSSLVALGVGYVLGRLFR